MTLKRLLGAAVVVVPVLIACHPFDITAMARMTMSDECSVTLKDYIDLIDRQFASSNIDALIVNGELKSKKPTCVVNIEELFKIAQQSPYFVGRYNQPTWTVFKFVRRDNTADFTIGFAVENDTGLITLPYGKHNRKL